MNYKKMIGIVLSIVIVLGGVWMIFFANDAARRIVGAKGQIQTAEKMMEPLNMHPVGELFTHQVGKSLEAKASQYDDAVWWLRTGGVIVVCIGGVLLIFTSFKKFKG